MSAPKHASPVGKKKQRTIIWSSTIAAIVLVGGIVNACDPNTSPPSQPVGNIATITSTTDPATTIAPTTTTPPPPPPATEVPQETATQAAPPPVDTEADCGSDSYVNSDGNCVHDPGSSPSGATAKCKDGTYSYSQHRSGTCAGHHGVAQWLTG